MNFFNTCRLCHGADPDRLISIKKNKNLANDIEKELHVKIENDDKLPQQICDDCLIRVKEWVFYKSSVERHQKYLKRCQKEQDSSSIEHSSESITESVSVSSSASKQSKNGDMVDNTQIWKKKSKTPTKSTLKHQRDIRHFLSPNKPSVAESDNGSVIIIEDDEATHIQKPNEKRSNSISSAIVEENNSEDIFSLSRVKIEAIRQIRENQGHLKKLRWCKNGTFCVYCEVYISKEYLFKRHVRLRRHMLNRQRFQMRGRIKSSSRSYYVCKLCALKFTNKQFLYQHAKLVHGLKRSEVVVSRKRNKKAVRSPDNVASDPKVSLPDTKSAINWSVGFENNNSVQIKMEDVKEEAVEKILCALCKIKFSSNQARKIHLALHSSSSLVKCFKCSEKFLGRRRYLNHLKKCFVLDKDSVFCNTCFDVFANPKLRIAHQKKYHRKLSHKCNLCDKHFKTISELKLHKRAIHFTILGSEKNNVGSQELTAVVICDLKNDENQRALCIFCTCLLNSVDDYESHFKFYCKGPFICTECKEEFVDFERFCDHRINIHRLIGINRSFLQIIRDTPSDLVERCGESSITSKSPNSNESRLFVCPKKCGTKNISDLKAHTDECVGSAFSCPVCFSFYTTENCLIRHVCKTKNSIIDKSKQTPSSDIINHLSLPSASSAEIILENDRTSGNTDKSLGSSVDISQRLSPWKSMRRRQSSDVIDLSISMEGNIKAKIINENEFKKKPTVDWPMANRKSFSPSYSNDRYKNMPPYPGYHRTTYTSWHSNSQQFQNPSLATSANDNIENDDRRIPPPPPPPPSGIVRTFVKNNNRTSGLFEQPQPQSRSEFKFQSYTQPKSNVPGRFYPASNYNSINFKYYFNINYDLNGQRHIKCKECGFHTKARETALQHLVRERGIWYCRYSEKMISCNTANTATHFVQN